MRLMVMGPQGSGKGTTGKMLADHLNLPFISLGKVFREIPQDHALYDAIDQAMDAGELVPLPISSKIIAERLAQPDCSNGFVLDGWCRRMEDLHAYDPNPDTVLVLDISRETSIKRITGRRICTSDGKNYNIYTLPKEQLKECKGELIQREDDTKEAVETRLNIYYTQTKEVIEHFKKQGIVKTIDAEGPPEEVFENALEALNSAS
ncbi:AAA family ATPase [candidate division WWE3 bacterium]|nr:AAA family ATPase [candidate division WWE3 bacterium]